VEHSFIDRYSYLESFIHKLDPRIKIISFFSFILFVVLTPPTSWSSFGLYFALILFIAILSKVPLSFILKRSLVIAPFVLMIAIFIPFFKPGEVAGGYSFGSFRLTLTYSGLVIFWNVLIKSWLSVLSMIMLSSTTKFPDLLKGLEKLKIPKVMILILSFMYRYIFVLVDEVMRMKRARDSRNFGGSKFWQIKTIGNMIGTLFMRTYERAERVYVAMVSRGFSGEIKTIDDLHLTIRDFCFLSLIILYLIFTRLWVVP